MNNPFDAGRFCRLEYWHKDLHAMSIPSAGFPLTRPEAISLGLSITELGDRFQALAFAENPPVIQTMVALTDRIGEAVRSFGGRAFVRLGSRSPKDSWLGNRRGFCVSSGTDAIGLLTDCSERMADDLWNHLAGNELAWIWVRQWRNIPADHEWRCVIRGGRVQSASQYHYRQDWLPAESGQRRYEAMRRAGAMLPAACRKVAELVKWQDVVADFVLLPAAEPYLVEINPLHPLTDPCLFPWNEDGRGVRVRVDGKIVTDQFPDAV